MRLVKIGLIIVFLVSAGLFGVTGLMKLGSRGDEKPVIESDGEALEIPCEYTYLPHHRRSQRVYLQPVVLIQPIP